MTIADPIGIGKAAPPPLLRLPDPAMVFARRAARFESLAAGSAMADFLTFMAAVAHAQSAAFAALSSRGKTLTHQALRAGCPLSRIAGEGLGPREGGRHLPLSRNAGEGAERSEAGEGAASGLDASWRHALATIIDRLGVEPLTVETSSALRRLSESDAAALDALAAAALRLEREDPAEGCLVLAALQVSWTRMAGLIDPGADQPAEPVGACPFCGSPPVASLVDSSGSRFLVCSMCATQWHLVRIKCANCASTKGIAYLEIENAGGLVKAETCDECRTYTKIVYLEKDPGAEPFADDLATLALDLLVGEAGWQRAHPNPFLLPGAG